MVSQPSEDVFDRLGLVVSQGLVVRIVDDDELYLDVEWFGPAASAVLGLGRVLKFQARLAEDGGDLVVGHDDAVGVLEVVSQGPGVPAGKACVGRRWGLGEL